MTRIRRPAIALSVIGYAAGASIYPALPEAYCGPDCEISIARPLIAFLLPTALLLVDALLRTVWMRDPIRDRNARAERMYSAIMLRLELLIFGLHVAVLTALATGLQSDVVQAVARLVPIMLGVVVVSIGNLLPRLRPNLVIGIRTKHTLADRGVWMKSHRIAGYVTVACGLVIAIGPVAFAIPLGSRMILLVGPLALLSIPALMAYSKHQASVKD